MTPDLSDVTTTKPALLRGFRVMGGTGLEPVTPSLSTASGGSPPVAIVHICRDFSIPCSSRMWKVVVFGRVVVSRVLSRRAPVDTGLGVRRFHRAASGRRCAGGFALALQVERPRRRRCSLSEREDSRFSISPFRQRREISVACRYSETTIRLGRPCQRGDRPFESLGVTENGVPRPFPSLSEVSPARYGAAAGGLIAASAASAA